MRELLDSYLTELKRIPPCLFFSYFTVFFLLFSRISFYAISFLSLPFFIFYWVNWEQESAKLWYNLFYTCVRTDILKFVCLAEQH